MIRLGLDDETVYCPELSVKWQTRGTFTSLGIKFDLNAADITALNFETKCKEFYSVLNQWTARNLTVFGRVTVIKALALSKLVHLFTALPNPPITVLDQLQRKCFEFIWCKKRDKIKRTTMFNDLEVGGFKVPHIESFCKSLKLSWVKRLMKVTEFNEWNVLLCDTTCDFGGHYIWCSNEPKPVFLKELNPFWRDVYDAWITLTTTEVGPQPDIENILQQPLFYNKCIVTEGKSFYYKSWIELGVRYISDIVHEDGRFLSWEELYARDLDMDEFPVHFLQYRALLHAIPRNWKQRLKNDMDGFDDSHPENLRVIFEQPKVSKYFYKQALKKIATLPDKSQRKWEILCNLDDEFDWNSIDNIPYLCTMDTKSRFFQLKILHRILPTNILLSKYGLKDTARCTFCELYNESLDHLFYECTICKTLWLQLKDWLAAHGVCLSIDLQSVIMGDPLAPKLQQHITLITKEFIFRCKLDTSQPQLQSLLSVIKSKYNIERHYRSATAVQKKWGPLISFFDEHTLERQAGS